MLSNLTFSVSQNSCLKNPIESDLGRRILQESIFLIDEIGLEQFTFKKLATAMGSTEASVYRYFENKHKLLTYLANWYWSWLQNKIVVTTYNLSSAYNKLESTIAILASPIEQDLNFRYIDEQKLYRIIIAEGAKVYLVKDVDAENISGAYKSYKGLCDLISKQLLALNPDYNHSHSLASTIVETCHNQLFFSEHLPKLTDVSLNDYTELKSFVLHLTTSAIRK
jgi:AcrR family transcriptional regulator